MVNVATTNTGQKFTGQKAIRLVFHCA